MRVSDPWPGKLTRSWYTRGDANYYTMLLTAYILCNKWLEKSEQCILNIDDMLLVFYLWIMSFCTKAGEITYNSQKLLSPSENLVFCILTWKQSIYDEFSQNCDYRAVGRSENPGVLVVIRWAKSVPPGWNRVNWSAKIWVCHVWHTRHTQGRQAWSLRW